MSFIDLLFPQKELEALGNKWHEPAPKRRKLDSGSIQVVKGSFGGQCRPSSNEQYLQQRRHRVSTPASLQYGRPPSSSLEHTNVRGTKRANSDSQSFSSTPDVNVDAQMTKAMSWLPSFIEPSLVRNYLQHLHPKDRHRYTISHVPKPDSRPRERQPQPRPSPPSVVEEALSSPGSLIADTSASPASTDSCPTPAAICEQFRSGPFGHIFDGMRLTDNEREMMEDLLSPSAPLTEDGVACGQQAPLKEAPPTIQLVSEDYAEIDQALLQNMITPLEKLSGRPTGFAVSESTCADDEYDVHSSGLSPAAEEAEALEAGEVETAETAEPAEEQTTSHRGFVVYDYSVLSVDDFFDLDEASSS
ncbi:hypothetical protein AYO20_03752 [Fonsecaea nubica]|uniref:Uncharacterized protein n=1 Tax=Fonsecaea nubica TaxID=856822 RepID=A0A178D6Z3_9EURO|nr:hypothetical protein AYO20_03752 [Fonsecaea nubica]OAL36983.1 hypothetical protein AYO20_03752 [Fonsecaea nubica]